MAASAKIQSGEISAHVFKKALMEKHGVDIDSDPTLAVPFYNILDVLSLLPSLPDSPESSRRNKPPGSSITSGKGREEEEVWTERTTNINDGFCWNKYGNKIIKKSPYPRGYFKCSYAKHQGCKAKRKVQQIADSPVLYEIIYSSRHTCQAANNYTHGSTSMIEFYTQVPSVTDFDLPPLVTVDHQESIIHDTVPLRNDDPSTRLLNPTIPINDIKAEDESSLNFTIPVNDMNDDDDEPVWSPYLDMDTFFKDDFGSTF